MYFGFKDISISYGKKEVIKDLTLDFPKGKIVTIIGPNGCGKSSLLRVISKAVKPKQGSVQFEERNLCDYKIKHIAKKIALLPQVHSSPPDIDVRTLVSYGRYPYMKFGRGLTREDHKVIDEVIAVTGLAELQHRIVGTLSGGERQRAWIAMAICQRPEILILDEPITYLDVSYQVELLELIRRLNQSLGITIIMVLHDINLAARYSDCLYVIKDKAVYAKGPPEKIVSRDMLRDIFRIEADIYEDRVNNSVFFIPQTVCPAPEGSGMFLEEAGDLASAALSDRGGSGSGT